MTTRRAGPADKAGPTAVPLAQEASNGAIAELARYLSPVPHIERVTRCEHPEREADRYVLLDFASANHDRSVWPDADRIDIHRDRKPHLAFGFGRHSCLGMSVAQHEALAFLTALLRPWPAWKFAAAPHITWTTAASAARETRTLSEFRDVLVFAVQA